MHTGRLSFSYAQKFGFVALLALWLVASGSHPARAAGEEACPDIARAEAGVAAEQYLLGRAFDNGACGVKPGKIEAESWYRRAAGQGHMLAQYELGETWFTGDGVPPDYRKAKDWYLKAAHQGHGPSQLRLGFLFAEKHFTGQTDYAEAEKWFTKAAAQNAGDAQFRLGNFYLNFMRPPDLQRGEEWLRRAAGNGHRVAMFDLGRLLLDSADETRKAEGLDWLAKAGNSGVLQAQVFLSDLYTRGSRVPKDERAALDWTLKVIDTHHAAPAFFLNRAADAYFDGRGAAQDYTAARRYYERAAQRHDRHALLRLARIYQEGLGVPKDAAKAKAYADRARPPAQTP